MTVDAETFRTAPLDEQAASEIAARGLEVRLAEDDAAALAWRAAVARGFQGPELEERNHEAGRPGTAYRRRLGVYDPAGALPDLPVATFATWLSELTVPGGRAVPASAISSVTVAATHRRRGLARSLMAGELRQAVQAGLPVAMLTASEATIYGRFGFAAAAAAATWRIDTLRAGWLGGDVPGRIDYVSRADARRIAPELHERIRHRLPGEVIVPGPHWDDMLRLRSDAEAAGAVRAIQYRDETGEIQGLAAFTLDRTPPTPGTVSVIFLHAATDHAYAALWRFLLEHDLVGTVVATERAIDEPLWWLVADQRAAEIKLRDHQYVRIVDVVAALEARHYEVAGSVILDVTDPLGITSGRYLLEAADDGAARVRVLADSETTNAAPVLALGIGELSAIYLGGVRVQTLAAAGRVRADAVEEADALFRGAVTPRLTFWY
ncbi:GNAT family N-acetyltransferase [Microbacterium gorillae]|uniref:GNAT family N-acetyltransferase n=1 Tax=Microbacterium gorillae TaxID=1231063 RepID=UPI003D97C439